MYLSAKMTKLFKVVAVQSTYIIVWLMMLIKYALEFSFKIKEKFDTMCLFYLIFVSVMLVISVISSILLITFIHKMENRKSDIKTVTNVTYKQKSFTNDFLLAYILPLLSFFNISSDSSLDIISLIFCILLLLIFTLFAYKQNYIFSNIIMELLDYRQYHINFTIQNNSMESILIVKGKKFKDESTVDLIIIDGFAFMK